MPLMNIRINYNFFVKKNINVMFCLQDIKLALKHKSTDESSSQRPRGLRRRSKAVHLLALRIKLPPGHGCLSFVNFMCCQV